MNVFTYYTPNRELPVEHELKLILLWAESWAKHGWKPKVLNEWHARQSIMFDIYDEAISKLPSVNPAGYDRACYLRWVAVSVALRGYGDVGVMSDYDVMNYGFFPTVLNGNGAAGWNTDLTTWEGQGIEGERPGHTIPSVTSGDSDAFGLAAKWFSSYQLDDKDWINGQRHTSDMYILEKHAAEFAQRNVCKVHGEEGWETARLVHFCNASMIPKGYAPRCEHIRKLREI